ncbi:hypothetical protein FB451DRAFT_1162819 [Mycena latifolia]|nr:hypothetical protein FB451DRAFT_1162819 [Mycena latifolia]
MPLLFSDLPKDIILEAMNHLALPDHISLLMTCSSIYDLSRQRSFWISVLETTRKTSTIACPQFARLSEYTFESLKGLAISWLKLQENWNRPFPRLMRPVTSTSLPEPADIIFTVQGTDIIVLHMKESGLAVCWDVKAAAPFAFPPITTGGGITGVSAPFESYGICSVALRTLEDTAPLHVVTIKHENGKAVSFESASSEVSIHSGPHFESLFVTEEAAGSMVVEERQEHCTIISRATSSDENGAFRDSVVNERDLIVCFAYNGHLYNVLENGISVQIQHISRTSLSVGRCEESGRYTTDILAPGADSSEPFCFILPSTPAYGVSAVFVRVLDENTPASTISFTFVLNTLTHASDDGVSSPLAFPSLCTTAHVPGRLLNMALLWMDHSGFNVVVVVESNEGEAGLMLVRYHPETSSTSSHKLAVPDSIDLLALNSLCVDESAGAVHLIDDLGAFSTLHYL